MGPSPACKTVSLCPNHPFSRSIKLPAIPPHTNARVLRFAKLGSMATVRMGRFISKAYDSGVDSECMTTCPERNGCMLDDV